MFARAAITRGLGGFKQWGFLFLRIQMKSQQVLTGFSFPESSHHGL